MATQPAAQPTPSIMQMLMGVFGRKPGAVAPAAPPPVNEAQPWNSPVLQTPPGAGAVPPQPAVVAPSPVPGATSLVDDAVAKAEELRRRQNLVRILTQPVSEPFSNVGIR